jgi:AcrR family transcriptional regulator
MAKIHEGKNDMMNQAKSPPSDELSATELRILKTARELFLSEGFSAVSTDRLSRDAGVSKTSIYKYFGDMGGVLSTVVRREGDIYELHFDHLPGTAPDYWETLTGFGSRLLTLLNNGFCIQFDRMLHEEARNHPDLVRRFYDAAYGRGHVEVTRFIAHGQTRGFVSKPQAADHLADHLLCMWDGLSFVRARLGLTDKPFANPEQWARQCVETLFAEDFPAKKALPHVGLR